MRHRHSEVWPVMRRARASLPMGAVEWVSFLKQAWEDEHPISCIIKSVTLIFNCNCFSFLSCCYNNIVNVLPISAEQRGRISGR
jgi:hypothetical protein